MVETKNFPCFTVRFWKEWNKRLSSEKDDESGPCGWIAGATFIFFFVDLAVFAGLQNEGVYFLRDFVADHWALTILYLAALPLIPAIQHVYHTAVNGAPYVVLRWDFVLLPASLLWCYRPWAAIPSIIILVILGPIILCAFAVLGFAMFTSWLWHVGIERIKRSAVALARFVVATDLWQRIDRAMGVPVIVAHYPGDSATNGVPQIEWVRR